MKNVLKISLPLWCLWQKIPPSYNSAFPTELSEKLLSAYLLDYATLTQVETEALFIVSGRKHWHELCPFGHLETPYLLGQSLGTHTFGPLRLTQLSSSDLVCAGLKALFCSPIQTIWATHRKNYSSARRPLSPLRLCQQCLISSEKFWFLFPLKGLPADIAVPFQLYNFIM